MDFSHLKIVDLSKAIEKKWLTKERNSLKINVLLRGYVLYIFRILKKGISGVQKIWVKFSMR